jgi:hypothetical protein
MVRFFGVWSFESSGTSEEGRVAVQDSEDLSELDD